MRHKRKITVRKRPVFVFLFLCAGIAGLLTRLAYLQTGADTAILTGSDEKRIEISVSRGYIYDCNMNPLVNAETRNVAALLLNEQTRSFAAGLAPAREDSAPCITVETEAPVTQSPFCVNVTTVRRYAEDTLCPHILGYTDSRNRGVCGIEKSYDNILWQAQGRIGVKYTANVYGQPIAGEGLQVVDEGYDNPAGVVLTIDSRVQRIVEQALAESGIKRGAAVVLDVGTGEIRAMASVPAFDPLDLSASLKDEDLPFLNRALSAYPVGSVFKPFVAAAALEKGLFPPEDYECTGSTAVGSNVFRCYHSTAHGTLDLAGAICNSCNGYFISLGQTVGAQKLTEICKKCGFGAENRLSSDLIGAAGNLPSPETIGAGELANLSFGQGELLATPLQMAAAFNTLAAGGIYKTPVLMQALVDEHKEVYARYRNEIVYRALSARTCGIINDCLLRNVQEGTGKNGGSELFFAAGKTATAQTGKYNDDGAELLCTWFCGFFPYEAPAYTVVIFNERGQSASADCAPVFRSVSEKMYKAGLFS